MQYGAWNRRLSTLPAIAADDQPARHARFPTAPSFSLCLFKLFPTRLILVTVLLRHLPDGSTMLNAQICDRTVSRIFQAVLFLMVTSMTAWGQTPNALDYSVATPRPISPAEGTTNPSAQATQTQNPYLEIGRA